MADPDTPAIPMTDADVPPAFATATRDRAGSGEGKPADVKQAITGKATEFRAQATDKARSLAEDGKGRATEALGQLTQLLNDTAAQVDEKLGAQFGQYARSAADQVTAFQTNLEGQSVEDLLDTVRDAVRKSPGVALGAAAAVGFVLARVLSAGLDQRDADSF